MVIVKLNEIVLLLTIMGEYFDYKLHSPTDCPDLRLHNEQSAAQDTR